VFGELLERFNVRGYGSLRVISTLIRELRNLGYPIEPPASEQTKASVQ
jgi:hypothetical protein